MQDLDFVVPDSGGGTKRGRMLKNVNRFDPVPRGT
jgi:hypothetical protein